LIRKPHPTGYSDFFFHNAKYNPPSTLRSPKTIDFPVSLAGAYANVTKPFFQVPSFELDGDLKHFASWRKSTTGAHHNLYIHSDNFEIAKQKLGKVVDFTFTNTKNDLTIQCNTLANSLNIRTLTPLKRTLNNSLATPVPIATSTPLPNTLNITTRTPSTCSSKLHTPSNHPSKQKTPSACSSYLETPSTCSSHLNTPLTPSTRQRNPSTSSNHQNTQTPETPTIEPKTPTTRLPPTHKNPPARNLFPTPNTSLKRHKPNLDQLWGDSDSVFESGDYDIDIQKTFEDLEKLENWHTPQNRFLKRRLEYDEEFVAAKQCRRSYDSPNIIGTGQTINIRCRIPTGGSASFTIGDDRLDESINQYQDKVTGRSPFMIRVHYLLDANKPIILRDRRATYSNDKGDWSRYFMDHITISKLVKQYIPRGKGPTSGDLYLDIGNDRVLRFSCLWGVSSCNGYKPLSHANSNSSWLPWEEDSKIGVLEKDLSPTTIQNILNSVFKQ